MYIICTINKFLYASQTVKFYLNKVNNFGEKARYTFGLLEFTF